MLTRIGLPMCVLLFVGLGAYRIPHDTARVAAKLHQGVSGNLHAASIDGVLVSADGRDIVLNGNVASVEDRTRAGRLARAVPGVRAVRNNLMIIEALPTPEAPTPSRDVLQLQLNTLLLEQAIEFDKRGTVVSASSHPLLGEIARLLQQTPEATLRVEGHTDDFGQAEFNQALSLSRAQAVVDYLVAHGVSPDRLEPVGFGQDRPIASNLTPAGRSKNRRVEVVVNEP